MTLKNGDTIELICFVAYIKYQIDQRPTFPLLSKATRQVVMAVDTVAMVSYIYYGKSVVQVLSPRRKVWVWDSDLGFDMLSHYSGTAGMHYQIPLFNNARCALFNNGI